MARRLALVFLAVAALLMPVFSVAGGAAADAGLVLLAGAFPFALMALGAARGGVLGQAALPIGLLFLLIELALIGMLALAGRVLDGPWLGGLPLASALLVYGLFLLPLAVTAVGFALTFRGFSVDRRDLERLRQLAPGPSPGEPG